MSTLRQVEANRRNSARSTGPRTAEGKAASRLNALQHGAYATCPVIIGEETPEFEAFSRAYSDRFQPAAPEEHTLLALVVRNAWLLDRYSRVEADLWNGCLEKLDPAEPHPLAETYIAIDQTLQRLQRCIATANRAFRTNLETLNKLQALRAQSVTERNGFVPSKPAKLSANPAPIRRVPLSGSVLPMPDDVTDAPFLSAV